MAGKIERFDRVVEIAWRLLEGYTVEEICDEISKKLGCTRGQVKRDIPKAREYIRQVGEQWVGITLEEAIAARQHLLKKAYQRNALRVVLDVLRDEAQLLGLYSPTKIDLSTRIAERLKKMYEEDMQEDDQ